MADRVAEFFQQAKMARQRAAEAEGEFRGQWLRVAEMWEMPAKEYERIRKLRPRKRRSAVIWYEFVQLPFSRIIQ